MRRLWGEEIVTTVPKATVGGRLAPEVVRFLAEVGLPKAVPAFDFDLIDPRRWEIVVLGGTNRDAGLGEFLPLSPRVVDIAAGLDVATGRIFDVDLRGEHSPVFVNSSLELFVRSLVKAETWLRTRPDEPGLIDADRRAWVELEALDPAIASYEWSTWPAYFYNLESGCYG